MHEVAVDTMIQATRTTAIVHHLIEDMLWFIIPIAFLMLTKSSLDQMIQGVLWHIGRNYDVDDIVIYEGEKARIVRTGLLRTAFYVYEWVDGIEQPTGGTTLSVSNDQLRYKRIEKPLDLHDLRRIPHTKKG